MSNIESKYQIKSEIDHILDRPGMYIGSNTTHNLDYPLFVPSQGKIKFLQNIGVNEGLIKLIDEVLSNSIDEHRRKDAMFPVTEIKVIVNKNGYVSISDNGGIPVVKHKDTGLYIPELIFGVLRSSSNYNDSEERDVIGTNGIGAKIANIYSSEFKCTTSDSKNLISVGWTNNMRDREILKLEKSKTHGTTIEFKIELNRFDSDISFDEDNDSDKKDYSIELSTARIIQKRCIDGCAANPGLKITFETDINDVLNSIWEFDSFTKYANLYLDDTLKNQSIEYKSPSGKDIIVIVPNFGSNIGFVNGAMCNFGTHINKVQTQIIDRILNIMKSKDMELITKKDIESKMNIFVMTSVINPAYASQTKTKLETKIDKNSLNLPKSFLDKLEDSEIVKQLTEFYTAKYAAEEKKKLRKLNGSIKATKVKKLISNAGKAVNLNELWLFEGNSAANGFRSYRNPVTQSAYLLRGKIKNTLGLSREEITENVELREILAVLNIQFNDPKNNIKNCKYHKIIIGTDADVDGSHITGLLLAFFVKHFPELIKAGFVYRSISPIIVCNHPKKPKIYFYDDAEYKKYDKSLLKGYELIYTKGLGGLSNEDYSIMLNQQKLIKFTLEDAMDLHSVNVWFQKQADQRKELMMIDTNEE